MTWIKLEEKAPRHPKVSGLSHLAFRVWVTSLCYASEFLTDGVLPPVYLLTVKTPIREELIRARLWDIEGEVTRIHDYLGHQSSRQDVDHEKQRNRAKSKTWRDRQKQSVTGNESDARYRSLTDPENREQRTDTENREQSSTPPPPSPKPIISGQCKPLNWGKTHSNHILGFCDWMCLPDFIFAEFIPKSPGEPYVREWAAKVRSEWEGRTIGDDNLRFWRERWSESHRTKALAKTFSVADAIARKAGER